MSMIDRAHSLLTCMIKKVLENQDDMWMSDRCIHEMADATIKQTPVLEIVSELEEGELAGTGETPTLMGAIELLGIVTAILDRHRANRGLMPINPGP
jgi:hypothetical protein